MSEPYAINLSTAWQPPSQDSRAWVRRFGSPSGIEPGTRVWLVIEGGRPATLVLNGVPLAAQNGRHDVTDLLESRNELLLIPLIPTPPSDASTGNSASPRALAHGRCDLPPKYGRCRLEIGTIVG